jgi:putative heme-binding domain-containing protein
MTKPPTMLMAGAAFLVWTAALAARQIAPDAPYMGSGLTRQQLIDRLTAADYTSTPSVADGKEVFEALCSGCHIFGDLGTAVGPDLTSVANRFKKRDILESILWPSKTISDQYTMTTLVLDDGTTVSGLITREDATYVFLKTADALTGRGKPVPIDRIKERKDSTTSLMPERLMDPLKIERIDNLVAFLLTGK